MSAKEVITFSEQENPESFKSDVDITEKCKKLMMLKSWDASNK